MAAHDRSTPCRRFTLFCAALALGVATGCTDLPPGRYVIDRVDFERTDAVGRPKVPDSEIEDKIATAESPRFFGFFPRGVVLDYELFDRHVLERDLARIERLYRARGYYEAHARAGRVEKTGDHHVRVTVTIEEGPRVNVGEVRVEGVAALPIDDAAAVLSALHSKLKSGRSFNEERYEEAQESVVLALGDRGYAFAQVKGNAEVDLSRHVADVTINVTPGLTARLGTITVTGLGDLPEKPVRRALDLSEGELYSTTKLDSARRAILGLGVFSEADVSPVLDNPASRVVPVNVRVVPSKLRSIKLGGGIELDVIRTDAHLLAGWEDRNFLGGLRRFTIDVRPGIVFYPTRLPTLQKPEHLLLENRARAEFRQPGFIEARMGGIVRGDFDIYPAIYSVDKDAPSTSVIGYRDFRGGVGLDRAFGRLYTSFFYNFQTSFPFFYVKKPDEFDEFKKVVLSYVNLKTTFDFRDDPVRPHAGLWLGNDLQFSGVPVTSNFRGPDSLFAVDARIQPEVRGYVPLAKRWTLAMRATTGFLLPMNYGDTFHQGAKPNADDVQLVFFRGFFSGGPNSNRGYPYRGVGPKQQVPFFLPGVTTGTPAEVAASCALPGNEDALACNFPTGGLTTWETSIELRFPIAGELSGATFCDASDVSRYRFDIRILYPHVSCGLGLHYDTPVGPVRLDGGVQIPGLQVLDPNADASEKKRDSFYAVSIGIGEAF